MAKRKSIKKDKDKNKKEVLWIVYFMIAMLAILIIFNLAFRSLNKFEYSGLAFTKEKYGQIPVYHYYYYFDDAAGQQYKYNLYLRNDPRKNEIPVYGKISFLRGNTVYLSINGTGIVGCNNSMREVASLSSFLNSNLLLVKAGTPDKEEAEMNNLTHVTCETKPANTVILIQEGNETSIAQKENCYTINIARCELLDAVEKFEVRSILDAKARG